MRIPTATLFVLLVSAALAGCTENADTDSIPDVSGSLTAGASAVLVTEMGLPAQASYALDAAASTTDVDVEGDVYVLLEGTPDGDAEYSASATATVLVGQCAYWVAENSITDDIALPGTAELALVAQSLGDPTGSITMSVEAVTEAGVATALGSQSLDLATAFQASATATADVASSADPSSLPALDFEVPLDGAVLHEGEHLMVGVCVDDNVGASIEFGGPEAPSGIPVLNQEILDSDGDGYGDSEERRHNSDEQNAESTPATANSSDNSNGGGDGDNDPEQPTPIDPDSGSGDSPTQDPFDNGVDPTLPPEPVIAAFFALVCLALAGYVLIWRPTA